MPKSTYGMLAEFLKKYSITEISIAALSAMFFISCNTFASTNSGITYHGRILNPDGTPVTDNGVLFKMQILTPDGQGCVMYQEIQSKDLNATSGTFSITINDGSGAPTLYGYTLDQVFGNYGHFNLAPAVCVSGTGSYTPNVSDGRGLNVMFKTPSMSAYEPMPTQAINFVPMTIEAKQVTGFPGATLFRVEDAGGPTAVRSISSTEATALLNLADGSSTSYVKSTGNGAPLPSLGSDPSTSSLSSGEVWFNSGSDQLKYFDGTSIQTIGNGSGAGTVTSVGSGTGLTGGPITGTGTLAVDVGTTAGKIVQVQTGGKLPALDGSALTNLSGSAISGNISVTNMTSSSDRTSQIQLFHGTDAISVTAPTTLVSGGYNLVLPANEATTGQVLSAVDNAGNLTWTTLSASLPTLADDKMWVGQTGTATAVTMSGDATMTNAGVVALKGTGIAGTYYKVTTDAQGRVSSGSTTLASTDVNSFAFVNGGNSFGSAASLGTNDANTLTLKTNNSAALTILSSGAVGVGTTSPSGILHVYTNTNTVDRHIFQNVNAGSAAYTVLDLGNDQSPSDAEINLTSSGNTTYGGARSLNFLVNGGNTTFYNGGAERMRITPAGNVGIGTTNPAESLDVGGGNVKMGYEMNSGSFSGASGTLSCSAGKQILGGGCACTNGAAYVRVSAPNGTTGWQCTCDAGSTNSIFAICANIK